MSFVRSVRWHQCQCEIIMRRDLCDAETNSQFIRHSITVSLLSPPKMATIFALLVAQRETDTPT